MVLEMAYGSENEHTSCTATILPRWYVAGVFLLRLASCVFDLRSETTPLHASCNLGHGSVRCTGDYSSTPGTQF